MPYGASARMQGLEHQHVERPLEDIPSFLRHAGPFRLTKERIGAGSFDCQREPAAIVTLFAGPPPGLDASHARRDPQSRPRRSAPAGSSQTRTSQGPGPGTPSSMVASRRLNAADNTSPMTAPVATTPAALPTTSRSTSRAVATERPRYSELTHTLLVAGREDPEHADHRQHERKPRDRDDEHRPEFMASGGVRRDVLERHHIPDADCLVLVDAAIAHRMEGASAPARPDSGRTTRNMSSIGSCARGT